jgi:hypothetical protein
MEELKNYSIMKTHQLGISTRHLNYYCIDVNLVGILDPPRKFFFFLSGYASKGRYLGSANI